MIITPKLTVTTQSFEPPETCVKGCQGPISGKTVIWGSDMREYARYSSPNETSTTLG